MIETITQNVINVRIKNGDTYTVHLGGCTEIESAAESGLPSVGDKIYWKGIRYSEKKSAYSYRGYKVTCFWFAINISILRQYKDKNIYNFINLEMRIAPYNYFEATTKYKYSEIFHHNQLHAIIYFFYLCSPIISSLALPEGPFPITNTNLPILIPKSRLKNLFFLFTFSKTLFISKFAIILIPSNSRPRKEKIKRKRSTLYLK